jgi:hypothetical protein
VPPPALLVLLLAGELFPQVGVHGSYLDVGILRPLTVVSVTAEVVAQARGELRLVPATMEGQQMVEDGGVGPRSAVGGSQVLGPRRRDEDLRQ